MEKLRFWFVALLAGLFLAGGTSQAALYRAATGGDTATVFVHEATSARVADIATGSTTETVAATFTLPALGANDQVEVIAFITGSGTAGTKGWTLRLGGTGIDGTVVANVTNSATLPNARLSLAFANAASASVQTGMNGSPGYSAQSAARAGAVDTSSAQSLYLTLTKVAGADVQNLENAKVIIRRTP